MNLKMLTEMLSHLVAGQIVHAHFDAVVISVFAMYFFHKTIQLNYITYQHIHILHNIQGTMCGD